MYITNLKTINLYIGIWNSWGDWSICSVTCGHGYKVRTRTCMVEQVLCEGDNNDYSTCSVQCETTGIVFQEVTVNLHLS